MIHALLVDRQADGFDKRSHRARRIGVRQKNAVNAGSQHLLKHPGVGANRGLVGAIHRNVHDHRRRAMPALGRPAGDQAAHVLGQAFDVERRVLHVVADVVGVGLRVFLALLEAAFGAGMRAGVINRLTLPEQFDGAVDVLGLRGLTEQRSSSADQRQAGSAEIGVSFVCHDYPRQSIIIEAWGKPPLQSGNSSL